MQTSAFSLTPDLFYIDCPPLYNKSFNRAARQAPNPDRNSINLLFLFFGHWPERAEVGALGQGLAQAPQAPQAAKQWVCREPKLRSCVSTNEMAIRGCSLTCRQRQSLIHRGPKDRISCSPSSLSPNARPEVGNGLYKTRPAELVQDAPNGSRITSMQRREAAFTRGLTRETDCHIRAISRRLAAE